MHVQAAILSAGDSRRMGEPKALLRWGAGSFLEHLQGVFMSAGIESIAVVVGGRHETEVSEHAKDLGLSVWRNEDPSLGPISSIRVALLRTD